MTIPDIN